MMPSFRLVETTLAVDDAEPCGEVRVERGRRRVQVDAGVAEQDDVAFERLGRVDEDALRGLVRLLVGRAHRRDRLDAARVAAVAQARHQRVVEEDVGLLGSRAGRATGCRRRRRSSRGRRNAGSTRPPRTSWAASRRDRASSRRGRRRDRARRRRRVRLAFQHLVEEAEVPFVDLVRAHVLPRGARRSRATASAATGPMSSFCRGAGMPRKFATVPAWKMSYQPPVWSAGTVILEKSVSTAVGAPVVVEARVLEPVAEIGRVDVEQRQEVPERQLPVEGRCRAERAEECRVRGVVSPPPRAFDREEARPAGHRREREGAARVGPAVVELRGREARSDRGEARRLRDRGQELGRARVREAVHADLAVRPVQACRPLHRLVAVTRLVHEGRELSVGGVASAHVLDGDHIAAARVPGRVGVAPVRAARRLAVRHAHEQDGERHLRGRPVDVGAQDDAVGKAALDVALDA